MAGDYTKLVMALAACLLGYGEVGLWLAREAKKKDTWVMVTNNPYQKWIDDYSGTMYQGAVKLGLGT
jgi:hydroxymethylpyrimidine/phosphomethylpyrimidine kinase / thiaminase